MRYAIALLVLLPAASAAQSTSAQRRTVAQEVEAAMKCSSNTFENRPIMVCTYTGKGWKVVMQNVGGERVDIIAANGTRVGELLIVVPVPTTAISPPSFCVEL